MSIDREHRTGGTARSNVFTDDDRPSGADDAIVRIETYALAVPLEHPPADAHAFLTHWTIPVVEVETREGLIGTGISGIHAGAELLCAAVTDYLGPTILGRASSEVRALWQRMYWSPLHWVGRAGVTQMALAMVDIALWDLAARRAGLPLWRYLGGHHPRLNAYNTDGGWLNRSRAELVDDMVALVEAGWTRVKMKVGKPDWREDVARIRAVRDAIGPDIALMCDVNKRWDLETALRMAPYLEEAEVGWLEEPLHPDDVRGHRVLQHRTRVPIALGESLYSHHAFTQFIDAGAVRIVQPDVTRLGGVTEFLQVQAAALAAGLWVVPHAGDMMQVHQHLVAAAFAEAPTLLEYIPWTLAAYEEPCIADPPYVHAPTAPGASTRIAARAR